MIEWSLFFRKSQMESPPKCKSHNVIPRLKTTQWLSALGVKTKFHVLQKNLAPHHLLYLSEVWPWTPSFSYLPWGWYWSISRAPTNPRPCPLLLQPLTLKVTSLVPFFSAPSQHFLRVELNTCSFTLFMISLVTPGACGFVCHSPL